MSRPVKLLSVSIALYDKTGSYNVIWWTACVIALITALLHVFIALRGFE